MPAVPAADDQDLDGAPIDGLNPDQLDAVVHRGGPLLVVAGAGSGKTRVLTHRIAHLIHEGVHPSRILAITFTNKAADEMRHRVAELVGPGRPHDVGQHVPLGLRADAAGQRRPPRLPPPVLDLRPGRRRPPDRVRDPGPRPRRQALHAARRARHHQPLEERAAQPRRGAGRGPAHLRAQAGRGVPGVPGPAAEGRGDGLRRPARQHRPPAARPPRRARALPRALRAHPRR